MANWFKTQKRRIKEEFLQSIGAHERTTDFGFDQKCHKFYMLDRVLQDIHASFTAYLESIDALSRASSAVSSGLTSLYTFENCAFDKTARDAIDTHGAITKIVVPAVKRAFVDMVIKPCGTLLAKMPEIHQMIERRKQLLLDFDSYRSRYAAESQRGKTSASAEKLSNKLETTKAALHSLEEQILHRFDELEQERPSMLVSELSSLVSCETHFHATCAEHLGNLLPVLPQAATSMCLLASYTNFHQQKFDKEMKANVAQRPVVAAQRHEGAGSALDAGAPDAPPAPQNGADDAVGRAGSEIAEELISRQSLTASPPQRPARAQGSTPPLQAQSDQSDDGEVGAPSADPAPLPPPPPPPRESASPETPKDEVVALYRFSSNEDGDLSFAVGDRITVVSRDPSGWWTGKLNGKQGIFPANRVEQA